MIAFLAQPLPLQYVIHPVAHRRKGEGEAKLVSGLQHQPQVLLLQVDGETGPEITLDDLRPAVVQHPASASAAADRLQRAFEV